MSATATAPLRPAHWYVTTDTGARLRLTRWAPGSRVRSVFRVMPGGALVELGRVTSLGGTSMLAAGDTAGAGPWGCTSYVEGARLLAERLEVTPHTVYALTVRDPFEGQTHSRSATTIVGDYLDTEEV